MQSRTLTHHIFHNTNIFIIHLKATVSPVMTQQLKENTQSQSSDSTGHYTCYMLMIVVQAALPADQADCYAQPFVTDCIHNFYEYNLCT